VGVPAFSHAQYEADDIVGTLMTRCRREGLPATLVTRDKDFAQLIRDGDVYWDYSDNAHYRYHQIEERFGVAPERFADFLALMGDSVDNIKGVPGVGAKTAAALMKEFASLEEIYDNLDKVAGIPVRGAGKLAARLTEHREAAYLARRLTEIACDMPIEIARAGLSRRAPDVDALTEFFDRHNFGPLLRRQAERLALLPLSVGG
jgi:5'-3' exonuclease